MFMAGFHLLISYVLYLCTIKGMGCRKKYVVRKLDNFVAII